VTRGRAHPSARPAPSALEIIRSSTELGPVPLVPEIRLYQASEPIQLWQRTEVAAGRTGLDPPFWAFAWAAAMATRPEPEATSMTRWPLTTSGWSSR